MRQQLPCVSRNLAPAATLNQFFPHTSDCDYPTLAAIFSAKVSVRAKVRVRVKTRIRVRNATRVAASVALQG